MARVVLSANSMAANSMAANSMAAGSLTAGASAIGRNFHGQGPVAHGAAGVIAFHAAAEHHFDARGAPYIGFGEGIAR